MPEAVALLAAKVSGLLLLGVFYLLGKVFAPILMPIRDYIMLDDDAKDRAAAKRSPRQ